VISAIPCYSRDEKTGQGYIDFGDGCMVIFGPYDDPSSAAAYDRTLARWLANGRQLTLESDDQAVAPDHDNAWVGPIPWEAFKQELLKLYQRPARSRSTRTGMLHALKCLDALGVQSTADLTPTLIADLVASRPPEHSPNTVVGLLRYVQAACSYAEKRRYLHASPFRIRGLSTYARRSPARGRKHATREEVRKVLDHMREQAKADGWKGWKAKRLFALTATLAYTGMRAGEAIWLQVADVDLQEGVIWVVSRKEHKTKTDAVGTATPLPLAPPLIPILEEWLPHRMSAPPSFKIDSATCPWLFPTSRRHANAPWHQGGPGTKPRDRMKAVAAQVGVLNLTPLVLRHSMATHLMTAWGGSAGLVKRVLRHTTEHTAQAWYVHSDLPGLKEAFRNVEY
jgi:integrase